MIVFHYEFIFGEFFSDTHDDLPASSEDLNRSFEETAIDDDTDLSSSDMPPLTTAKHKTVLVTDLDAVEETQKKLGELYAISSTIFKF